jgi:hydroxyacylglutathione hydrolase
MEADFILGDYQVSRIVSEYWQENCYLVNHTPSGELAVIDPGNAGDSIIQAVEQKGANLKHVFLTHAHHDHVASVAMIHQRFSVECTLHQADLRLLRHAPMYAMRFGGCKIQAPKPFATFSAPAEFEFGTGTIRIFHSPGHTSGSVCYLFDGFSFTGDTLLHKQIGRTDLPGGETETLLASVNRLVEEIPAEYTLFPGHGKSWKVEDALTWWKTFAVETPKGPF